MSTITSAPTLAYMTKEADRRAAAVAQAHDAAAIALAEMARQAKGAIYRAIAESRHGLIEEEAIGVIEAGELGRALLAALVADGEVEHRAGVYSIPRTAA